MFENVGSVVVIKLEFGDQLFSGMPLKCKLTICLAKNFPVSLRRRVESKLPKNWNFEKRKFWNTENLKNGNFEMPTDNLSCKEFSCVIASKLPKNGSSWSLLSANFSRNLDVFFNFHFYCQIYQKLSKLSKIIKIVKNCQNVGEVMVPHHSAFEHI